MGSVKRNYCRSMCALHVKQITNAKNAFQNLTHTHTSKQKKQQTAFGNGEETEREAHFQMKTD